MSTNEPAVSNHAAPPSQTCDLHIRYAPGMREVETMNTEELREAFLVTNLFPAGRLCIHFTDLDRMAVGGVMPAERLALPAFKETGTDFFLQRREMGIINIGNEGLVTVDGADYPLNHLECLYVGRGAREVVFAPGPKGGSAYYFVSTPAHAAYPTTRAGRKDANILELGEVRLANRRRILQYIHETGIRSCQLVMGYTELIEGSVWNTMPPHTHGRRTEIYFYFDLAGQMVFHLLGMPSRTRHVLVRDREAVLAPSWSVHSGAGTGNYRFIWAMGGENQAFSDMDSVAPSALS